MERPSSSKQQVVVIVGTTGVGKSKLAIEIAKRFNGEVVSADSMQIYKGLDIVTNKVNMEEMEGVHHHLISIFDTSKNDFNAREFVSLVIPIIEDITSRSKLPIIVGGTNYYIEALLWFSHLSEGKEEETESSNPKEEETPDDYELLKKIDPEMASKLHPNDKRKIKRSISVYLKTGKKQSEFVKESRKEMRYEPCILWVQCNEEILKKRLRDRVDDMEKRGLMKELEELYEKHKNEEIDFTKGIFQSIGFKEFIDFLQKKEDAPFSKCIEALKQHNCRYAKVQLTWIKQRFIKKGLEIHKLDSTDLEKWETNVLKPAIEIVDAFINSKTIPITWLIKEEPVPEKDWQKYTCDACNGRELNGTMEWNAHLKSKAHRKAVKRKKKTKLDTEPKGEIKDQ